MEYKREKLLDYFIDINSFESTICLLEENLKNDTGMQIVTINPEMMEIAESNNEFSKILKNAELVVADGVGIKIAFKLKRINIEQIRGIEVAKELVRIADNNGYNIAFFGSKETVINKACENLKNEFTNLNIVYKRNGYFNDNEENGIIEDIVNSQAKIILVALGAPKQELFIDKCKKLMPNSIFIGVGGSFDVWSGEVKRAPEFFQKTGLEWLYRTINQPERFKRIYKTLPVFLFKAIIESVKQCVKKG